MNFSGKNILITGASSGIGKELTRQLSKHNCNLYLISRRIEVLSELKEELESNECNIFVYQCDVTVKEEVAKTFSVINSFTDINVAILNAGISCRSNILKFNSEQAKNLFDVNIMGIIYWVELLAPIMIKNKRGIFVGVSSLADSRGYAKSEFYCASKAAVTRFLEGLRLELAEYGVKVLTVKPGFVRTPMTDKNRFKMPFLMDVDKAVKIIIKGIQRERKIIQFPLPTVIGSKLIGILPVWFYDLISRISKIK